MPIVCCFKELFFPDSIRGFFRLLIRFGFFPVYPFSIKVPDKTDGDPEYDTCRRGNPIGIKKRKIEIETECLSERNARVHHCDKEYDHIIGIISNEYSEKNKETAPEAFAAEQPAEKTGDTMNHDGGFLLL